MTDRIARYDKLWEAEQESLASGRSMIVPHNLSESELEERKRHISEVYVDRSEQRNEEAWFPCESKECTGELLCERDGKFIEKRYMNDDRLKPGPIILCCDKCNRSVNLSRDGTPKRIFSDMRFINRYYLEGRLVNAEVHKKYGPGGTHDWRRLVKQGGKKDE